ncbi:hypothetical protein N8H74_28345 [Pseudomonas sp. B2M1-30]|uniref:hypothetical protein n=1 Tax=Pseudomonas TaxID=286 RepID=UPI0021C66AA0|nr:MULTISPECIES: hypothetical protein [Pseudomonas]MCU0122182.1 hypothetical protein [Pseudomonas sp. B2M1-30]MCU7264435.1 hypothetical protein [Pseudomonas koreensis]
MQTRNRLLLTGCLLIATQAQALDSNFNYYGPDQPFAHPAPPSLNAPPPRAYEDEAPQDFIVIPDRHVFHDSQLPTVADATVRVFVRSYDPERGIYVNDEVLDPTCLLECLARPVQITH